MNDFEVSLGEDANTKCSELARLGEFYCAARDYTTGLRYYEAAIQYGTNDTSLFAAICSQAGFAAFYANESEKALLYLKQDLKICRLMGDRAAEAKCCGNLTHILKALRRFDDAATYGEHQLALLRSLRDRVGESRALFALAGVHHAKAKHISSRCASLSRANGPASPSNLHPSSTMRWNMPTGDTLMQSTSIANWQQSFSSINSSIKSVPTATDSPTTRAVSYPVVEVEDESATVRDALKRAATLYEEAYVLSEALEDRILQGRACGNLANAAYMLGDFATAYRGHRARYQLAIASGDVVAQRRALSNAGNAALLSGDAQNAIEAYRAALELVRSTAFAIASASVNTSSGVALQNSFSTSILGGTTLNMSVAQPQGKEDRATLEAQTCFLLATAYLSGDQPALALAYFEEHFRIARRLHDRVGQSRSCAQLANVHSLLGNHESAIRFARRHLRLSSSLGDDTGVQSARDALLKLGTAGSETESSSVPRSLKDYRDANRNFLGADYDGAGPSRNGRIRDAVTASASLRTRRGDFALPTHEENSDVSLSFDFDGSSGESDSLSDCSFSQTESEFPAPPVIPLRRSGAHESPSQSEYDVVSRDLNTDPADMDSRRRASLRSCTTSCNEIATVPKETRNDLSSISRADYEATFDVGASIANISQLRTAEEFNASRLAHTLAAKTPPGAMEMLTQHTLDSFSATPRRGIAHDRSRLNLSSREAEESSNRLNKSLRREIERLSTSLCHDADKLNVSFKREAQKLNNSLKQEMARLNVSLREDPGKLLSSSFNQAEQLNADTRSPRVSTPDSALATMRTPDRPTSRLTPSQPSSSARRQSMENMQVIQITPSRAAIGQSAKRSASAASKPRTGTPSRVRVVFADGHAEQLVASGTPTQGKSIVSPQSSFSQLSLPPARRETFREKLEALNENVDRQSLASADIDSLQFSGVMRHSQAGSVSGSSLHSNASSTKHKWSRLFKKPKPVMGLAAISKSSKRDASKKRPRDADSAASTRTNSQSADLDVMPRTDENASANHRTQITNLYMFDQESVASSDRFSYCSGMSKPELETDEKQVGATSAVSDNSERRRSGGPSDMFDLLERCASRRFNDQRSDMRLLNSQIYNGQAFSRPNKTQIRHAVLSTRQMVLPAPSSLTAAADAQPKRIPRQGGETETLAGAGDGSEVRSKGGETPATLFELIDRLQSNRLDDQRCSPVKPVPVMREQLQETDENNASVLVRKTTSFSHTKSFFKRALQSPKRRRKTELALANYDTNSESEVVDRLPFAERSNSISISNQTDRIGQTIPRPQRELTDASSIASNLSEVSSVKAVSGAGSTLPTEDFFSLLSRVSSSRIDTQRATVDLLPQSNASSNRYELAEVKIEPSGKSKKKQTKVKIKTSKKDAKK